MTTNTRGRGLGMIRISTIFIGICMVLIAASLGLVAHSIAGLNVSESCIVAVVTLTFLILYNLVALRLRDRNKFTGQIEDLSHGTADLARQMTEFGRRLLILEQRSAALDSDHDERVQTALNEIDALGALVKQLAMSIAGHDDSIAALDALLTASSDHPGDETSNAVSVKLTRMRSDFVQPEQAAADRQRDTSATAPQADASRPAAVEKPTAFVQAAPVQTAYVPAAPVKTAQLHDDPEALNAVKKAIETNRIDLFLQPLVTLPQRKVRFYEAVSRIRDDKDQLIAATDFITVAEAGGLMGQIDHMVLLRCIQVLRRLMVRNKDIGMFCNISGATLGNPDGFAQCLDFLEANRALAPSLVLEFKQETLRRLGPIESEHLAALAQRGYRFSVDHVTDLRIEPRELADRGVRFIKVPANLLLDQQQMSASDIHPADLSDLLGRFGIDLVAERIEGESAVVDLLDYDIRFGQGFLFAPPRPLRPEAAATAANGSTAKSGAASTDQAQIDPARLTGKAALARRASLPN